ncbi:MAG: AAA domain-containing protein [Candidatus Woesearchaeota archaeon]
MNVLESFQQRLQDISKRNRSLFCKKIVQKKVFDLHELTQVSQVKIDHILSSIRKSKEDIPLISLRSVKKTDTHIQQKLTQLYRDITNSYHEKGYRECYVGYPFVEGHYHDKTEFRAPLILYPVEIILDRKEQVIKLKTTGSPQINETFFRGFTKFSKGAHTVLPEQITALQEADDKLEAAKKLFKVLEITITEPKSMDIIPFAEYVEHPDIQQSESRIIFKPFAVLGQFTQRDSSLSNDYDSMISESITNELLEILLGKKVQKPQEQINFSESDLATISIPDASQENIIYAAKKSKGLVIHGPPGTGKSQVITNIIADKMKAKQKILMVCDKRAALDVVANRLQSKHLDLHTLLIHDARIDRNEIFAKIARDIESYQDVKKEDVTQLDTLHTSIESRLKDLDQLKKIYLNKLPINYSLYELYTQANPQLPFIELPKKCSKYTKEKSQNLILAFQQICEYGYELQEKTHPFYGKRKLHKIDEALFKQHLKKLELLNAHFRSTFTKKDFTEDFTHAPNNFGKLKKMGSRLVHYNTFKDSFFRFFNPYWFYISRTYAKIIREQHLTQTTQRWMNIQPTIYEFDTSLSYIAKYINPKIIQKIRKSFTKNESFDTELNHITQISQRLSLYKKHDQLCQSFSSTEKYIYNKCLEAIPKENYTKDILKDIMENSFAISWIARYEKKIPLLKTYSYDSYCQTQKDVLDALEEKTKLVPKAITNEYIGLFHTFNQSIQDQKNTISYIYREVTKKRNRLTLRQLFEKYGHNGLFELYPCIMCSPETASELFSLEQIFDTTIFDEASQIRIEKAIPAIVRSNQLIVAGDEQQLPPTSFFLTHSSVDEMDYAYTDEEKNLLEDESLLVRTKTVFESKRLSYHYRSAWPELIEFSNAAFYHNNLTIINPPKISHKPIEFLKVSGIWYNQENKKEAQAVVQLLQKELAKNTKKSFGIITFNSKQRDLIEEMLVEEMKKNTSFAQQLEEEFNRTQDSEFIGLFVKNIENVQGDERDVIIFSIGYGFDSNGVFRYNFGPLNGMYGPNRLNVAISRAKEQIYVCASINPSDFSYKGSMPGPKLLGEYLAYAKAISEGKSYKNVLEKLSKGTQKKSENPFSDRIHKDLLEEDITHDTDIGNKAFSIHCAVKKQKSYTHAYLAYSSAEDNSKEFDFTKPYILTQKKWNIQTVYPHHWFSESARIINEIKNGK